MATSMETAAPEAGAYPIRLTIERPDTQARLTNFPLFIGTLIRLVLLLPSLLVYYYLATAAGVAFWLSLWGILFTGRYPRGLFKLQVGALRWGMNVSAYLFHLFDPYPPMDLDQRPDRELILEVDYPERPSRWLNLPFFPLKFVLAIPHLLILMALYFLAGVVVFIAQFVILFSGSFPAGLHSLVVGYLRWQVRTTGYLYAFTDKYPPFSLS